MDMKIALAQYNYKIGDIRKNADVIIKAIQEAENQKADIIVFSELALCGYPPYDLLHYDEFIKACNTSVEEIKKHTQNIAVILGLPEVNPNIKGKPFFNAAFVIYNGKIIHKAYKSLLPDYDVFDECRYFEPAQEFKIFVFKEKRIGITICEDIWHIDNESLYNIIPMEELKKQAPDLVINISASPFDYTQQQKRYRIIKKNAEKYQVPIVYVNQIGAHTDLIFDGCSMGVNKNGHIISLCKAFEEDMVYCNPFETNAHITLDNIFEQEKMSLMHRALVLGIKDYFDKSGLKKAVLGLSGGIDSAVTYALAVEALGKDNVFGIMLPSQYSSQHSIDDAVALAENMDGKYAIIPIENSFNVVNNALSDLFAALPNDITEENIQARLRAVILMAYANKYGSVLLNTSNKSEAAVGYGTLYGDMCGGLAVLADVYKTEVYQLANYLNRNGIVIPENSITKVPSAELRPEQKDSDSLPEYDILDKILFNHIENALTSKDIYALGFAKETVDKVLKLVAFNEYKRFQSPPVLRISPKAFGSGRKIPIVANLIFGKL